MRILVFTELFLLLGFAVMAQQTPAPAQSQPIILSGGTAHLGNGQVIENAWIRFENGRITDVTGPRDTSDIDKTNARIIDTRGKHIYPGLIAPDNTLGLAEIGAVRATRDYSEVGGIKPNVRSLIALSTDSRVIANIRSNGILTTQLTPRGGRIPGTSSVINLDAWNWEDAVIREDDGVHLNWPRMSYKTGRQAKPDKEEKNKKYKEDVRELEQFFDQAKAYAADADPETVNVKFEAMRGVFNRSKNIYIRANLVREIISAIDFARTYNLKMVLLGGRDAWMISETLKANNIPVILFRPHSLPSRPDDDVDISFKTPHLLESAGVLFCISYRGGMEAAGQRNLPFVAGTAAAYGMDKEAALQAVTLNTAKILGVDKDLGSLEKGKLATLIVSSGDLLDIRTNNVEWAFIEGRAIDLDNKQKALYRKFMSKYAK